MTKRKAYHRLRCMMSAGLLEHHRVLHGRPGVYTATKTGLALVDLKLPVARLALGIYEHEIEATALLLRLEREFEPEAILTDRELRAADTGAASPRFAVRLGDALPSGLPRLHFPDFVIQRGDGNTLAVEYERTTKGATRLRRILRAYARARHLAGVRYYVASRTVERAVRVAARQEHATGVIDVISCE